MFIVLIFRAFNWKTPQWLHLPLITRDGRKKLSKRDSDSYVNYYDSEQGYLPLAVLNYLLRNGSGLKNYDTNHLYSLEEMVNNFDENEITTTSFMVRKLFIIKCVCKI